MEIYDREQAETTKAGLSEPIGWAMLSFRHDAWQNRSHDDKAETSRACLVSPRAAFPTGGLCTRTQEAGAGHSAEARGHRGFEKPRTGTG